MIRFIDNRVLKILYIAALSVIIAFIAFVGGIFLWQATEKTFFYPVKYKEEIISSADTYGLERKTVFAMVKTESGFNKNAESNKGAKGLMQITDDTANYIAALRNIAVFDIKDVSTNLDFGCYYLRYLINKFKSVDTAIAAYNAGEGTVEKWLKDPNCSKNGLTLYRIPYRETENYLKKIEKNEKKYNKLYGNILDKNK